MLNSINNQNTMKNLLIAVLALAALVLGGLVLTEGEVERAGGPAAVNDFSGVVSNSSVEVGPGNSEQVAATSTSRKYLVLSNDSAEAVYLSFSNPASVNSGMLLAASSTYEINPDNLFVGSVHAITTGAASSSVLIIEAN